MFKKYNSYPMNFTWDIIYEICDRLAEDLAVVSALHPWPQASAFYAAPEDFSVEALIA